MALGAKLHWYFDHYRMLDTDGLYEFLTSDTFYPSRYIKNELGDLKFDIDETPRLSRDMRALTSVNRATLIHSEVRVYDIAVHGLQSIIFPAPLAFLMQNALYVAELLIEPNSFDNAKNFLNAFFEDSVEGNLADDNGAYEFEQLGVRYHDLHTESMGIARALVVGHELGHLLDFFTSETDDAFNPDGETLKKELECDERGVFTAIDFFNSNDDAAYGARANFWSHFEHYVVSLHFGNLLKQCIEGFPLFNWTDTELACLINVADARFQSMVEKYREETELGYKHWPEKPIQHTKNVATRLDAFFKYQQTGKIPAGFTKSEIFDVKSERLGTPYLPYLKSHRSSFLEIAAITKKLAGEYHREIIHAKPPTESKRRSNWDESYELREIFQNWLQQFGWQIIYTGVIIPSTIDANKVVAPSIADMRSIDEIRPRAPSPLSRLSQRPSNISRNDRRKKTN